MRRTHGTGRHPGARLAGALGVTVIGVALAPGAGATPPDRFRLSAGQHDLLDDSQAAPFCAALS